MVTHRKIYMLASERREHAHKAFAETLAYLGDLDEAAAHKVKNLYLRHRIASLGDGVDSMRVKEPVYLTRAVIRRAVAM